MVTDTTSMILELIISPTKKNYILQGFLLFFTANLITRETFVNLAAHKLQHHHTSLI